MRKCLLWNLAGLLLAVALFSSCYKDKGNYSYHPINEVKISADTNFYSLMQFDSLKITPVLNQSIAGKDALTYTWGIYNSHISPVYPGALPEIISTEKNLNVVISQPPRAEAYTLVYTVTDTTTGVSFKYNFSVTISAALSAGWMVLTHQGNKSDIDFILPDDQIRHNVYSTLNATFPLPEDASKVYQVKGFATDLTFVLWDNGGYILDKNTYQVIGQYADQFYGAPAELHPELIYLGPGATTAYIINNGRLHSEQLISGAKKFSDAFAGKYSLAPYVITGLRQDVFFDKQNHRFGRVPTYGTSIEDFPVKSMEDAFDLNNIPGELLTIQSTTNDQYIALFKTSADDSTAIYTLEPDQNIVAADFKKAAPETGLNKAGSFACSPILPQLYYSNGNSIYLYDIAANKARELYSFPDSEKLEIFKMNGNDGLVAATYDGSHSTVYLFNLASTGNIEGGAPTKTFTGFDHIIDISYKNK
ncbi:hypothetical protein GCM10027566_24110 [Arachidicoccus ginsenosidivorans]